MYSSIVTAVKQSANYAAQTAKESYIWAGRKVEQYSTHLPDVARKVITATFWALPYTAALVFAPSFVFLVSSALLLGFWGNLGHEIDEGMTKEHRQHLFAGIRNASVIRAAVVLSTIATGGGSTWLLATTIQCLFIALQAHKVSYQDTPPPAPQPQPVPTT
ncbi:MAG: hypothetical protein JSR37_07005 [Verrucomicrobia bacterium]|nr:hypothetical protein [Verrucomicrobiota bacterium]MBS0637616.1 hypothetical protein [Verrucomicrobiota bacterium]